MKISGEVYDKKSGKGIPLASISIVDRQNAYAGQDSIADSNGRFEIESAALDNGGKIFISSIGYQSLHVDPFIFLQTEMIGLDIKATELPTVVVTPRKKDTTIWWLLAAGAIAYKVSLNK